MPGAPESPAPPRAGTPRWYAWLFTPPPARPVLAQLFQLETELRAIVVAPRDHGVAHLKLHWWREELGRLVAGAPRHPLTRALVNFAPAAGPAWPPLADFLASLELELAAVAVDDQAELDRFLALADGLPRSIALALGDGPPAAREALGMAAGQAMRGVQIVADWCATEMDEPRREAMLRLAASSRVRWNKATSLFGSAGSGTLRGLRVQGALGMALLARLERAEFSPGHGRELPPIRCLWTAWRAARQHGSA